MNTYMKPGVPVNIKELDNCPDFLERYLLYLSTFSNKRPATIIDQYSNLQDFLQYTHYKNTIGEIPTEADAHADMDISCMALEEMSAVTGEDIERYLYHLETIVRNARGTLRKKLHFLRRFFDYLLLNAQELQLSFPAGNPTSGIQIKSAASAAPAVLTPVQIERLVNAASGEQMYRDRAIVMLLATSAITLMELVALNRDDIQGNIMTVRKDGAESRQVYLTAACQQHITRYIADLTQKGELDYSGKPLFLATDSHRRITRRTVQKRIEKLSKDAGLTNLNISPKVLRDSAISMILRSSSKSQHSALAAYFGFSRKHGLDRLLKEQEDIFTTVQSSGVSAIGENGGKQ